MFNMSLSVLCLRVTYLKVHRFAVMFAYALLLDLSKEVIVPSCTWDEADNLILLF